MSQIPATVCPAAVVAVVVAATAVMVPTKRNSIDHEMSREKIFFQLSHFAFDKMIIALSEHNAILPLSGVSRGRKEQVETKNTCDKTFYASCIRYMCNSSTDILTST